MNTEEKIQVAGNKTRQRRYYLHHALRKAAQWKGSVNTKECYVNVRPDDDDKVRRYSRLMRVEFGYVIQNNLF